jgi:hypothetical protein
VDGKFKDVVAMDPGSASIKDGANRSKVAPATGEVLPSLSTWCSSRHRRGIAPNW